MADRAAAQQRRQLSKKLSQIFRMRGLSLRPDAMQPLMNALSGDTDWETTLQAVLSEVQLQNLKGGHVDAHAVRLAVDTLTSRVSHKPELRPEITDCFTMPRLRIDTQRRTLVREEAPTSLHAEPNSKASMYSVRLAMVEQRVRRNDVFKPPILKDGVTQKEYLELTSIDALLGRAGTRVILGMLCELEEGKFFLEDAHSTIQLDLSEASTTVGLFTRQAVVLAEGEVTVDGVFKVRQLGLPPPESRSASLAALGNLDTLHAHGPGSKPCASSAAGTVQQPTKADELALKNAMVVVLSDLFLDQPAVLARIASLLEGYEQVGRQSVGSGRAAVPLASFFTFVLCGNFASSSLATSNARPSTLSEHFAELAKLINANRTLAKHSHFVLVPGPDDATVGAADVLPRAPLSASMTESLTTAATGAEHMTLATAPCRLSVCGQDIVILREDLLVKARRACVLPPCTEEEPDLNVHLVKSVLDQAYLAPIPKSESAVFWEKDHSLWLHPSPDVLVLADRQEQFQHVYEETLAFNPGSFSSGAHWMVYRPAHKGEAEQSSL